MTNIEQLEAKCESLRKAVESGDMSKLGDYAYALAKRKAAELGVDMPDLEHVDSSRDVYCIDGQYRVFTKSAQSHVDREYIQFLEAREERLKVAIREALYWLDVGSPGRALEVLRRAMV